MMILNVFSILEMCIGVVSLVMMAWGGSLAFLLALRWKKAPSVEARSEIEKRSHLVLLVAVVVLGIRLFNWPLFYASLQSFIPDIDGAMCIFGVTQVRRILTGTSELLKPLSFFLIGAWLLLHMLDQKSRTSSLMGPKLFFLGVTAAVVVMESLIDVLLMFRITPGTLVSCCTTVTDILDRPTRLVPRATLGPSYEAILGKGYYLSNLLLMGLLGFSLRRTDSPSHLRRRRWFLGFLFLCALGNSVLFLLAQIEVHAPRIMALPFHHCLYCLWQYVPDTILMYLLFVVGTSAVGWAFVLDLLGRSGETMEPLAGYLRRLCGLALFCYAGSMIMNTVHLIAA
jgi:uncharacterized membrane protein YiaA